MEKGNWKVQQANDIRAFIFFLQFLNIYIFCLFYQNNRSEYCTARNAKGTTVVLHVSLCSFLYSFCVFPSHFIVLFPSSFFFPSFLLNITYPISLYLQPPFLPLLSLQIGHPGNPWLPISRIPLPILPLPRAPLYFLGTLLGSLIQF